MYIYVYIYIYIYISKGDTGARVVSQPHHVIAAASTHARHKCGTFWICLAQLWVILGLGCRAAIYGGGGAAIYGGRGFGVAVYGGGGEGTVTYRGGVRTH